MEKLTVLVVDDDREIVESIAIFLQADGYLVRKAYNGLEALDIVMTENVHLIILDIMMPELDGIKTLLKVRESKNLPNHPAVGQERGRGQNPRTDRGCG